METITRTVRLHQAQADLCRSGALYRGFVGGRGSGKTWAGAYDLIRRARRGRTYLVGSPTGILMHDITFPKFSALARDLGVWDPAAVRLTPYPTARLSTGAEIRFRTAEDPEKMRGPDLSGVWLDEASLMTQAAFDVAIGTLREGAEQGWLTATFTPKGLSHWTYEVFGGATPRPNTAIFHSTSYDNPFLPADFAGGLAEQYTGLRAEQEVGGRFVTIEGAEWPAWYFDGIGYDELPPSLPIRFRLLALDPSKGRSDRVGDFSSLADVIIDTSACAWVDPWLRVLSVEAVEDEVVGRLERGRYDAVIVECNGFQELIADNIVRKCAARGIPCPMHKKTSTENKEVRIRLGLGPVLAQKRVRLRTASSSYRLALQQLREFPSAAHDDFPDSLALAFDLVNFLVRGKR